MNLTDLSAELQSRASDTSPDATARLVGVRGRIRARRRRQAAAAALVAAGCVAAVLLGPNLRSLQTAPVTVPAGQIPADTFDDVLAGDPLTDAAVGVRGASEVVLEFTPIDTNLSMAEFCHLPDDSMLTAATTVNGHSVAEVGCEKSTVANGSSGTPGGGSADETRSAWANLGVVPGRKSEVRIRLQTEKGSPTTDPDVRLGVALYALTGDRLVSEGVTIKKDAEIDGHDYRLVSYVTSPVRADLRDVMIALPEGRHPYYFSGGTTGDVKEKDAQTTTTITVDGEVVGGSTTGGISGQLLDDTKAHTMRVQTESSSGVMVLAGYERVD